MGKQVHKQRGGWRKGSSYCGHRGPSAWLWRDVTCDGCVSYVRELLPAIKKSARIVARRLDEKEKA